MVYQDDLREEQVVAIWVGDFENEDDLTEYVGQPFEKDFGFLLDQEDLPAYAVNFPESSSRRRYGRSLLKAEVHDLLAAFDWSDDWKDEAERLCRQKGFDSASIVLVFPNLRYCEELSRNPQSRLQFIGNVLWIGGREQWQARLKTLIDSPPFPVLVRRPFGDGDLFTWEGRVHLKSWTGFATAEALAGMSFRFSDLPEGIFDLDVKPVDVTRSKLPTHAQARAFQHLLDNEEAIRNAVLNGIFAVYGEWRENYYGAQISSDGGKTYKTGWELPDLFPPEKMPEIKNPNDLLRMINTGTVHVLSKEIEGFVRIGFGFRCKWDEEHGLGVLTHKGTVVDVGQADTAFTDC
jgi:Domain of unknown function (DUF6985)/Immunity protein 22